MANPEILPKLYQTGDEVKGLMWELDRVKDVPGDLIEVGVMWGGSARLIRQATKKPFYLFDTFTGLPDIIDYRYDSITYSFGTMSVDLDEVQKYFKKYNNVFIYPGIFPDKTGKFVKDKKFSFVHLDVDIYKSTKEALKFLYPKVSSGGSIVIHDYPAHRGVKKAVDEFMKSRGSFKEENGKDFMINEQLRQIIIRKK